MKQITFLVIAGLFLFSPTLEAQTLERRLDAVENYVDRMGPAIEDFSFGIQRQLDSYTQKLEATLNRFTSELEFTVEDRINQIDYNRIYLNPVSKDFQRIDTNVGILLVGVNDISKMDRGYRMTLNIGNPNYVSFKDFKIRVRWGRKWREGVTTTYDQWRASLKSYEFSYRGVIERGTWNEVDIDLVPATQSQIAHIECEITVSSIVDMVQK